MDKRIKRVLIILSIVIFFIASPVVIIFSQGYRFDFETKRLVKTGALSFKPQPKECEIYLDDKLKKKTDFFFGETFIKDLVPKEYKITIEKDNYFPWEKTLEVKEGMVTEVHNVILFPKNLNFSLISPNIEDYFLSPNQRRIILKKNNQEGWKLDLLNLENNNQRTFLEEKDLTKEEAELIDITWNSNSNSFLLEAEIEETKYFVIDISQEEPQLFSLGNFGKIKGASFNPNDSQEILFLRELNQAISLFKSNYSTKDLPELILKDLITYKVSNNDILWLDNNGLLNKSNFSGEKLETVNEEPFPIKEDSNYQIEIFSNQTFIKEENNLYQLNQSSKTFESFTESIRNMEISQNQRRLCLANTYEILILFLEDDYSQPRRKAGEKLFLTRLSKEINQIFWLNPDYLIFNTGNKIKIAEIDNRDKLNIVEITEFEDPKIAWNNNSKKLYILSQRELFISNQLLP